MVVVVFLETREAAGLAKAFAPQELRRDASLLLLLLLTLRDLDDVIEELTHPAYLKPGNPC
jgi:hypothetical protein